MADVSLVDVCERLADGKGGRIHELIQAAAGVANAIHAGVGGMIRGSLMEEDLRRALGLKSGELVNIPKPSGNQTGNEK